jgi:hypothetical protein
MRWGVSSSVSNAADRKLVPSSRRGPRPPRRAQRDRNISLQDLNKLRLWMETKPEVPEGPWYKDFGSFKICGEGKYPKTFLLAGQLALGRSL